MPGDGALAPRTRRSRRGGVTAIVLAAGLSSRMAAPKAVLPLRGKPLLAHVLDALQASQVREILVVLGADADRVRREVPMGEARAVLNPEYAMGMSTSIRAGLRAASRGAEAFLIVLGDQPLVSAATVDALLERRVATDARVLVPTYDGVRGNPVLLHRSLSAEMESVEGDVGCRGVVAAHAQEVVEVRVDDPGILVDVDNAEDLRSIEDALRAGTPLARLALARVKGRPGRAE